VDKPQFMYEVAYCHTSHIVHNLSGQTIVLV
jgi:hypothetical protein